MKFNWNVCEVKLVEIVESTPSWNGFKRPLALHLEFKLSYKSKIVSRMRWSFYTMSTIDFLECVLGMWFKWKMAKKNKIRYLIVHSHSAQISVCELQRANVQKEIEPHWKRYNDRIQSDRFLFGRSLYKCSA